MALDRRTLIAGLGATALMAPDAVAQERLRDKLRERREARREGKPGAGGSATGAYGKGYDAAAKYSAERFGVSLLVMQDGKTLFETYPAPDGGPDKAWELASGTKSFTGVMAAAASADGLLKIDERAADTLTDWKSDPLLSKITIRNLLSLNSGIKIDGPAARPPAYAVAASNAKAQHQPGTQFEYGPEPFQIFGEILTRKLKAAGRPMNPVDYLKSRVLDPIDVKVSNWVTGADGNPFLPQGAHLTARNWARFGKWVHDGAAGVDPAVSKLWFESSSANPGYGLSWWLLRPGLLGPNPRAGVNADTIGSFALTQDIVMAAGAGFQRLYLCRKKNLIVVRQANRILQQMQAGTVFKDGEFLEILLG
jgi:CubicO group peptidase (beta-lactamase class C family)